MKAKFNESLPLRSYPSFVFRLSTLVLALLLLHSALCFSARVHAATFTVTTPADGGPGSLREAIYGANGNPGPDTIAFNLQGARPRVIELNSQLPDITGDGTRVDGTTQPGYAGAPQIVLSGWNFGNDFITCYRGSGLVVRGNDCTVRGLLLIQFGNRPDQHCESAFRRDDSNVALRLHGARGRVYDCLFGTAPDGLVRTFNGRPTRNGEDVQVLGPQNVVEDCTLPLLLIFGGNATDNVVRRCNAGFRRDGRLFADQTLTGYGLGIVVVGGARNRIGEPGAGNRAVAVRVGGNVGVPYSAIVQGNIIGLAADGALAFTIQSGLFLLGENYDTLVGGLGPGQGNLLVGPSNGYGISVSASRNSFGADFYSRRLRIEGNELRGFGTGIRLFNASNDPQAKAVLVSNLFRDCQTGILAGTDASIFGNRFPGTRLQPIMLRTDGGAINPPNDPFDFDAGPNGLQNTPEIESIRHDSARDRTIVEGRLRFAPARLYRIELYSSSPAPGRPAGGDVTLGTVDITTDFAGGAPFRFELPGVYADRVVHGAGFRHGGGRLDQPDGRRISPVRWLIHDSARCGRRDGIGNVCAAPSPARRRQLWTRLRAACGRWIHRPVARPPVSIQRGVRSAPSRNVRFW